MLWDELAVATNGETYMGYLKNLDFSQRNWSLNDEHPPLGKYIYGVSRKITKSSQFLTNLDPLYSESRALTFSRFFSVLIGGLAIAVLFLMVSQIFDRGVGLISAFFLAVNPHFLAYTRIACLEMPLLLFSLLFVWAFLSAVTKPFGKSFLFKDIKSWILVGILLGASLASRSNGVFLFFLFEAGLLLFYKKELFDRKHIWKIFLPLMSLFFLYIIWPWLWPHPISNFWESIDRGMEVHTKEYFLGKVGFNPFYYYFVYFFAIVPLLQLFLFIFGLSNLLFVGRNLLNRKVLLSKLKDRSYLVMLFILLYFLTPFLASFVPLKQDGIRYVQFFLPAFCVISALGFIKVTTFLEKEVSPWIMRILLSLIFIYCLYIPIRFYPYYSDYYNGVFGSLDRIVTTKMFEMGWWGEGSLDAVSKVNFLAHSGNTVFVDFAPGHTVPSFIEGVKSIKRWQGDPDFVIVNLFSMWYGDGEETLKFVKERKYELIYEVQVANDVTIVWVYEKW